MLSHLFLGISLIGAEWVLYLLLALSIVSISLIFERVLFYRVARQGLADFRREVRRSVESGKLDEAARLAAERVQRRAADAPDLEAALAAAMIQHAQQSDGTKARPEILSEVAHDTVMRERLAWEKNLSILATIGSNAPFLGLFGTVLGIIKAFHDLSQQAITGAQTVTAGISEALVATAIGLIVAIPAVVAFNFFQRRVKTALTEAESLKSFLIGKLAR